MPEDKYVNKIMTFAGDVFSNVLGEVFGGFVGGAFKELFSGIKNLRKEKKLNAQLNALIDEPSEYFPDLSFDEVDALFTGLYNDLSAAPVKSGKLTLRRRKENRLSKTELSVIPRTYNDRRDITKRLEQSKTYLSAPESVRAGIVKFLDDAYRIVIDKNWQNASDGDKNGYSIILAGVEDIVDEKSRAALEYIAQLFNNGISPAAVIAKAGSGKKLELTEVDHVCTHCGYHGPWLSVNPIAQTGGVTYRTVHCGSCNSDYDLVYDVADNSAELREYLDELAEQFSSKTQKSEEEIRAVILSCAEEFYAQTDGISLDIARLKADIDAGTAELSKKLDMSVELIQSVWQNTEKILNRHAEELKKKKNRVKELVTKKYLADVDEIVGLCREILIHEPDDILARFYIAACKGDHNGVNECLDSFLREEKGLPEDRRVDWAESILNFFGARHYAPDKSMLLPLQAIIDSVFPESALNEKKQKWRKAVDELTKEVKDGTFDAERERDVFIAYSAMDMAEVNDVVRVLESEQYGLRCFVAARNICNGTGKEYETALKLQLDPGDGLPARCKFFVLISTPNSRGNKNVRKEMKMVMARDYHNCGVNTDKVDYGDIPIDEKKKRVEFVIGNRTPEYYVDTFFAGFGRTSDVHELAKTLCDLKAKRGLGVKWEKPAVNIEQQREKPPAPEKNEQPEIKPDVQPEPEQKELLDRILAEVARRAAEKEAPIQNSTPADTKPVESKPHIVAQKPGQANSASMSDEELEKIFTFTEVDGGYGIELREEMRTILENVVIPSRYKGQKIISINECAFCPGDSKKSKLKKITIPDSVTSIGDEAFSGCSDLTSVSI